MKENNSNLIKKNEFNCIILRMYRRDILLCVSVLKTKNSKSENKNDYLTVKLSFS